MPRMEVLFLGLFILLKEEKHGERVQLILNRYSYSYLENALSIRKYLWIKNIPWQQQI